MSEKSTIILSNKEKNSDNCVKWARQFVPNMPFGLFTFTDKKNIINSKKAKVGSIAIIETDKKIGHVAVVIWVGKNHITIKEANFKTGKITQRHDTEKDLKVLGYFNPEK